MPYLPESRQYRSFAASNFQASADSNSEVRDAELDDNDAEPSYIVRGYFCTFRQPYELYRDYFEEIDPHAFDECDMSDVVMQVNHDGRVYARNRNGSLQITTDEHGGHIVADLGGSKQGRENLFEEITNGLIDTMSFGFTIADDGFEWDEDDDGVIRTRITKISKLYDVSAIAGFAANPNTEISARSLRDGILDAKKALEEEQRKAAEAEEAERRAAEDAARMRRVRRARALALKSI